MMAGIGYKLRKLLDRDTLTSEMSAYFYAGLASAGPLLISILGIFLVGLLALDRAGHPEAVMQFQVSVTYLIAFSLLATGPAQLVLVRSLPNPGQDTPQRGALASCTRIAIAITAFTGGIGLILAFTAFRDTSVPYRLLMLAAFVVLSNIWLCATVLASTRRYMAIFEGFCIGYLITVAVAMALSLHGLEGLLCGFVVGHLVLYAWLTLKIYSFDAGPAYAAEPRHEKRSTMLTLAGIGLLFNLGLWVDKFIFWFSSAGQDVIGPLRASIIYDFPIFISYLCIIPGMAVFLLRLETGFSQHFQSYHHAICHAGTLNDIRDARDGMIQSARVAFYEILKVQAVVVLLVFAFGDALLESMGISTLYLPLLRIDVIATSLQVLLLASLNIFFYLDKLQTILRLTALFALTNALLTWWTLEIGPAAYGYGFATALLVSVTTAMVLLSRSFQRLEFDTFMMQGR